MSLFSKLNNVMSTKRIVNQPLPEEKKVALEEAITFGNKTQAILEEMEGTRQVTEADLMEEEVIANPDYCKRLLEELMDIYN